MAFLGTVAAGARDRIGLGPTNIFKQENKKAALLAATILTFGVAFDRLVAHRFGTGIRWGARVLTVAGVGVDGVLNARANKQALEKEHTAITGFIAEDGKLEDVKKEVNKQLAFAEDQSKKTLAWARRDGINYSLKAGGKDITNMTREGLLDAMENQLMAIDQFLAWSLDKSEKPGGVAKGEGKEWALNAFKMAEAAGQTAGLLIAHKNLPSEVEQNEDVNNPVARRTPEEIRTYIENPALKERDTLIKALNAAASAAAMIFGDACLKPDREQGPAGYSEEYKAGLATYQTAENGWQAQLVTDYNAAVAFSAQTSAFLQASRKTENTFVPAKLEKTGSLTLPPYPADLKPEAHVEKKSD